MGPTKVRRTAKKSKFRKSGPGHDSSEVENATALALEEKAKELRLNPEATVVPATAADVASAGQTTAPVAAPEVATPESAPQATTGSEAE